ncbi:unnamed protein product [Cuscuta europaea]|uniref:CRM domain-containing protein n=1 Tax=Cuscuta europaea TaxID=41803 RepID=A0A9P1E748_CUSEU|nr:unnamed protein product [Cuscuta europaea]
MSANIFVLHAFPSTLLNSLCYNSHVVLNRQPIIHSNHQRAKIICKGVIEDNKQQEIERSSSTFKAPTAPWMNGPLLVEPKHVLHFSKRRRRKKGPASLTENETSDSELTRKEGGGRSKKAMKKIFLGINKLKETLHLEAENARTGENGTFNFSPGVLLGDNNGNKDSPFRAGVDENVHVIPEALEKTRLGFSFGKSGDGKGSSRMPWKREQAIGIIKRTKKEKVMMADETGLGTELLERLTDMAARMRQWVKVKKAGVTQAVVDRVHCIWRADELAMLKFDVPLCQNMVRAKEIVEIKTGGCVVMSKKDALVVYRGHNYPLGLTSSSQMHPKLVDHGRNSTLSTSFHCIKSVSQENSEQSGIDQIWRVESDEEGRLSIDGSLYQREADRLLDSLGPRFVDWWYPKPLPVDADLLPEVVPGFKTPFRRCPPFLRPKLMNYELTYLRKLARPLPTHFVLAAGLLYRKLFCSLSLVSEHHFLGYGGCLERKLEEMRADMDEIQSDMDGIRSKMEDMHMLITASPRRRLGVQALESARSVSSPRQKKNSRGRNRKLQGLANAVLKLWEKCHIAKISLKWGVPNTDNGQMAEELKRLTGGVLLLRNKFIIILYRGKDFLPSQVATLVAEREALLMRCQLHEEFARLGTTELFSATYEDAVDSETVGTLSEFRNITDYAKDESRVDEVMKIQVESEKAKLEKELRSQEQKRFILKQKIEKSIKVLEKLDSAWKPSMLDEDKEIITEEERECLRSIGLTMDKSLVLGRRGVFDGVVEGLHQHWKHREVVKVITMQRTFSQVLHTAELLEAESGGVLVSVDKLKEGHAILLYRGKNYNRPKSVPQNLLNKGDALRKSLEMQRLGSMKLYAKQKEETIMDIKNKLI